MLIRYFAIVREKLGRDEETLEIPYNYTADQLRALVGQRNEALAPLLEHVRAAVNQRMVPWSHRLADGDEVAFIPPVAGGADCLRVVSTKLDPDEAMRAVASDDAGGIATFHGVVRRRSKGRTVLRLEYEAYGEMAEAEFRRIAVEANEKWPGTRVAILHRVGTLEVGETAVIIAASAPHRAEAFAACRFVIDTLKERAPIWKKEIGDDGEVWVGLGP